MAPLISDKDFKTKGTNSPKEHNNPEFYAPNNRASKYINTKLVELKEETN